MSTPAEVKEHNERVLNNLKRAELVEKFALSIGCNDGQAATIAKAYSERFVYDGATLEFNGRPVTDPEARADLAAHFRTHHLDFLLPAAGPGETPEVNPALLEQARAKNMTAYSSLVRQHGKPAIDALLAKEKPDNGGDNKNDSKNPWRSTNFRTDKAAQAEAARLIKALGTRVAASMAKAAGKTLDGAPLRA